MILRSIYNFGCSVIRRVANKVDSPVLVLLYHRVTRLDSDPYLLAVTPDNFRAQMEYVKHNFPILRFVEDWTGAPKPSVVVTFDDGYADNLFEALPILEEFDIPATFFVTTGPIETGREFWWDELEFLIFGNHSFAAQFELADKEHGAIWPTTTDPERKLLHQGILPLMQQVDVNRREDWLNQLRQWAGANGVTRISRRPMTIDELRTFAKSPLVTIGAHGVTHVAPSAITATQQKKELTTSKGKLESWLGHDISVYAYPYGDRSVYTRKSIRLCRDIGFKKAAVVNATGHVHRWTSLYQVPRRLIINWPVHIFARKISEFLT